LILAIETPELVMKFLPLILTMLITTFFAGQIVADDKEALIKYARMAAQMELAAGALDVALNEGADTALIGSIDVLEYDLGRALSLEEKEKVRGIFRGALAQILTPGIWVESTAEVYARHLEVGDLRHLTDFYQTESGAKILAIQGALGRDLGDTAERLLDENQAAFADRVDSALEEAFRITVWLKSNERSHPQTG
jgi:hypothetical protein